MFSYCFQAKTDTDNSPETCNKINEYCPTFCTNTSCIDFNPKNDGKLLDEIKPEDSKDPEYSFCQLTSKSQKVAIIYTILNTINIVVAISIIVITMKYRGSEKGKLKNKLIKRLSYISDRYSYLNEKYHRNKLKNSNINIASNNTNNVSLKDNNNNNNNIPNLGFHYQYSEPEAIEIDESEQNQKKYITNNNNNSNKNSNKSSNNTNRITYHIPVSNNTNNEVSGHLSPRSTSPYITPEYIEEQNRIKLAEEERIIRMKKILKSLFGLLIIICISLSKYLL